LTPTADIPDLDAPAPTAGKRRYAVFAWCLYDWAITPFPTIVTTFVISNYYAHYLAVDPMIGSSEWSYMVGMAGLLIAFLSPPLGAIADRMGHAKRGIAISLTTIILAGSLLYFARPDPAYALPTLLIAGAGIVAMELGLLFYNALLPSVAPAGRLGRVSGWGWASGYIGGLVCLGLALVLLVQPDHPIFGIPKAEHINIRAAAPLTAIWAAVFGWPLFFLVSDIRKAGVRAGTAIRQGLGDLLNTIRDLKSFPQLAWFLTASAIYRDGITTILTVGGLYAGGTFGMDFKELIAFGMGLNVTAGIGAAAFAWLDDWIGSKRTVILSLIGLIAFGGAIILIHDKDWFFWTALALGVFIGPAQSASRSLIVRLSPPDRIGKSLGLYALVGRAVTFVGPFLFGVTTAVTHSQRAGLCSTVALLMVGLAVLTKVHAPHNREA
jgi:MFS transporter, UMF1 family